MDSDHKSNEDPSHRAVSSVVCRDIREHEEQCSPKSCFPLLDDDIDDLAMAVKKKGHKKSNKRVGAVVGAVLGATLGNGIASSDDQPAAGRRYASEERCRVYQDSHSEQRVVGYEVRYQYQDQTYTTVMDKDPGDTIRVRLAITPVS